MTKNTRRSGNKINLSAKTARKVRAAIARANMPPLPVDGHKIRLQKLAKARKAAQQAGAVQDHEATAKGPDEGIALREFGKPSRAGRSTTYLIVVFEGEKFSRIVAGWEPAVASNRNLVLEVKKKRYPLYRSSEYLWIDLSTPTTLAKIVTTKTELLSALVGVTERHCPTLAEISHLEMDDSSQVLLSQMIASQAKKGSVSSPQGASRPTTKPIDEQVAGLIPKLQDMTFLQLRQIWMNALRMKSRTQSNNQPQIDRLLESIEGEWQRRGAAGGVNDDDYFKWPSTDAPLPKRSIGQLEVPGFGMLSYLEYHVGRTNGQPTKVRQSILDRVFVGKLPPVFDRVYMRQWGDPGTSRRLQKMAETLAALARNFKRRDDDRLEQAIREWEADLTFLYDKYYIGKFNFAWPIVRTR